MTQSYFSDLNISWNNLSFKIQIKNNQYINGNDLCCIGNKKFEEWLSLES